MYVMCSNCHSNNITHKNIHNKVGSWTQYTPFNSNTTNCESIRTSRDRIPLEMASHISSITTLYSTMLFDEGQRHLPPEDKM